MTWATYPWNHLIVDDFLSDEDFKLFQQQAITYNETVVLPRIEAEGPIKGHYRYKYEQDPLENYNLMGYFDTFNAKRPHGNLNKLVQLVKTCEDASYPIHEDAPHKIFSVVIYISPQENIGTNLYDSNKNLAKAVEWKPNRALMFCPLDGITWHDYGSSTERYTLQYNLIDKPC